MARVLRRGDVVWADLGAGRGHEQRGERPILVLSHEVFNSGSGTVIGAAVTSQPQRAGFPLTLRIPVGSMPKDSWVKLGQIRTISCLRLRRRICRLPQDFVSEAVQGLMEIVG